MSGTYRHIVKVETCHSCGAVGKFKTTSTRMTRNGRVSYVRCKVCGAKAMFVYTKEREGEKSEEEDRRLH